VINKDDFIFLGYKLKKDFSKEDNFIWDDMFFFVVRKINGKWTLKGVSG
jgi:hypothetical protein